MFYFEKTVGLQAVARNDAARAHVDFTPFSSMVAPAKLWYNVTARILTLLQSTDSQISLFLLIGSMQFYHMRRGFLYPAPQSRFRAVP